MSANENTAQRASQFVCCCGKCNPPSFPDWRQRRINRALANLESLRSDGVVYARLFVAIKELRNAR